MKKKRFSIFVFFLVIAMMAASILAACQGQNPTQGPILSPTQSPTQSKQTKVTGTFTLIKEDEKNPDYSQWLDDQGVSHLRQHLEYSQYKSTDERLTGWCIAHNNHDIQLASDGKTITQWVAYGVATISSDEAGRDIRWLCTSTASIKSDESGTADVICSGWGVYQGLRAEFTLTGGGNDPNYSLNGVIIE